MKFSQWLAVESTDDEFHSIAAQATIDPGDEGNLLVVADWLEDHEEPQAADIIRKIVHIIDTMHRNRRSGKISDLHLIYSTYHRDILTLNKHKDLHQSIRDIIINFIKINILLHMRIISQLLKKTSNRPPVINYCIKYLDIVSNTGNGFDYLDFYGLSGSPVRSDFFDNEKPTSWSEDSQKAATILWNFLFIEYPYLEVFFRN